MTRVAAEPLWQVTTMAPPSLALALSDALDPYADSVAAFELREGVWMVEGLSVDPPDRPTIIAALAVASASHGGGVPDVNFGQLAPTDWLTRNRQSFPPLRYGRFLVHGSHLPDLRRGPGIAIEIDAARAFGSGSHATTEGCLRTLEALSHRMAPARVLDMGCGTGILAIAAARLWPGASVLAADNDPAAVRTAVRNALVNRVAGRVRAAVSDGYLSPAVAAGGRYDLIVANILAAPLARMAPRLRANLAPGGRAVLSGLMLHQGRQGRAARRAQGLALASRRRIGQWSTLLPKR